MGRRQELGAQSFLPERVSLTTLRQAVQGCHGCHLYEDATQAVFGEGLRRAKVMLVGEKPGDREDIEGKPFVGPAGRLIDKALDEAGIDREDAYVTNVVKHFKFERRGKRRLHQKPTAGEIQACRPWLESEIAVVKPEVVVCLGATAAQALLGKQFRITKQHGEVFETEWAPGTLATWHPSAILRADDEDRGRLFDELVTDLELAAKRVA